MQSVFVPLTFVAGIYGMNFDNMTELQWHYGYYAFLGASTLSGIVLLSIFYRRGWFD